MDYGYGNIDNLRSRIIVLANNKEAAVAKASAASLLVKKDL
jgi:hypothetical protein